MVPLKKLKVIQIIWITSYGGDSLSRNGEFWFSEQKVIILTGSTRLEVYCMNNPLKPNYFLSSVEVAIHKFVKTTNSPILALNGPFFEGTSCY